jgi:hypothetical protein
MFIKSVNMWKISDIKKRTLSDNMTEVFANSPPKGQQVPPEHHCQSIRLNGVTSKKTVTSQSLTQEPQSHNQTDFARKNPFASCILRVISCEVLSSV